MRLNFTTLFNINYLSKGLALYYSLLNSSADFHLYIFAVDDISYKVLAEKDLVNATIIPIEKIESEQLLVVKQSRTISEYCWTCKPFIVKYCLEKFILANCTYLDGDLYFYKDPLELITLMEENSVLITPHNYHNDYDQSATSGIYCAQLVSFKNTDNGNRVLNWWAEACIKWCSSQYEDGKWADQKYLDSWPYMFDGVYICKNKYAGVAPWNAIDYQSELDIEKIIFYHFHDLIYFSDDSWFIGGYEIPNLMLKKIYRPYIKLLKSIRDEVGVNDCLSIKDKRSFAVLTPKYKVGIYILDIKTAVRTFFNALFFIKRGNFYKNNFIK